MPDWKALCSDIPVTRPLKSHIGLSIASFITHLAAFVLILLVALSLPIIKPIYLLSIQSVTTQPESDIATILDFGVWGVCAKSLLTNSLDCLGPQLGYSVPDYLFAEIGVSSTFANVALDGLFVLLVLHPVSAALITFSFILSLFLHSDAVSIIALIISVVAGILSSVVFAADLAVVLVLKNEIEALTPYSFTVSWGNAIWMVLTSVILTWAGVVLLSIRVCFCCGLRRKDSY